MHHLGLTRSSLKPDHLLQTPNTFIRTPLPGAQGVEFVIHVAPQLGARFTQMTAEFGAGGMLGPTPAQRFVYVLEGELGLNASGQEHVLAPGGFAFLPQGTTHSVRALVRSRAALIEKHYHPPEADEPQIAEVVVGKEAEVAAVALMGELPAQATLGLGFATSKEAAATLAILLEHVVDGATSRPEADITTAEAIAMAP